MSKWPPSRLPWHPPLAPEDVALWDDVKTSVKRLRAGKPETKKPVLPKAGRAAKLELKARLEKTAEPVRKPARKIAPPLPADSFDRVTLRKIKTGRVKVEDSLDLHGLRRDAAHTALEAFILRARTRGLKLVLVVTGKGNRSAEGGVLRKHVPRWLKVGLLQEAVLSFSAASVQHGGEGAFYVRLRKRR